MWKSSGSMPRGVDVGAARPSRRRGPFNVSVANIYQNAGSSQKQQRRGRLWHENPLPKPVVTRGCGLAPYKYTPAWIIIRSSAYSPQIPGFDNWLEIIRRPRG